MRRDRIRTHGSPRAGRASARARARALRAGASPLGRARPPRLLIASRGRSHALDGQVAGRVPGLRRGGLGRALPRRRRDRVHRFLPRRHRRHDRALARARRPGRRRAGRARHYPDASERGGALGRGGAGAPLRAASLAVRAHRHRRQPLCDPARAPRHAQAQSARLQLVLPRHRRRELRRPGRGQGRRAGGEPGPAGAAGRDDARRRVERRRGAPAGARPRRRGLRAGRAGADEHRHRDPAARVPRRVARADAGDRDAPDHRRDAHALLRPGRLHPGARARARPAHGRQGDRERHPLGGIRLLGRGGRPRRGGDRPRGVRRRRRGGHAGRERALPRGRPGHARACPDRGRLRPHDRARRALRGGRAERDRRLFAAVARHAPGLPRRVPLPFGAPCDRDATPPPAATTSSTGSSTCTRSTAACS